MPVLYHNPGQTANLILETFHADGYRVDAVSAPEITFILDQDGYYVGDGYDGYVFTKFATGLYKYEYTIPAGGDAVGTHIINVEYTDPSDDLLKEIAYQIIVTLLAGNLGFQSGS